MPNLHYAHQAATMETCNRSVPCIFTHLYVCKMIHNIETCIALSFLPQSQIHTP